MNGRLDLVLVPNFALHCIASDRTFGSGFSGAQIRNLTLAADVSLINADMSKKPRDGTGLTGKEAAAFRIHQLVEAVGGSQRAAEIADKSARSIERYEFGDAEPPFDVIAKLANHIGWSMSWIATGTGHQLAGGDEQAGDMVRVPRFDLKASAAGKSRALVPDNLLFPAEVMSFSATWLRRLGVEPQFAELLIAQGDSMEPTIRDGDMMLLNRGIRTVETAGIYVVTIGGMIVVKRAFIVMAGDLTLKSDNPIYPEEVVPYEDLHSVTIEGRVRLLSRPI